MLLSEKVKNATAAVHKELEALSDSQKIFDKTYTVGQYGIMLQNNYRFCVAIEKYFNDYQNHFPHFQLQLRRKCNYLLQDLQELKMSIPEATTLLPIKNAAEFLGSMYVAEGAMLGGQVIKKQLQQNTSFVNCIAFRYYTCYGENLRNRWIEFIEVLNKFGEEQLLAAEDVVEGAVKGFNFYKSLAVAVEPEEVTF